MSLILETDQPTTSLRLLTKEDFEALKTDLNADIAAWLARQEFSGKSGQVAWISENGSQPDQVLVGWDGEDNLATLGGLPFKLPEGVYRLSDSSAVTPLQLLGWGLGAYRFDRYKTGKREPASLLVPDDHNADALANQVAAITLVRDLINIPASDLPPGKLASEAMQVADTHNARCSIVEGEDLLTEGHGAIHAVGRAAEDAPRLVDITWGEPDHPKITLIGKGVCFDSGGLDIKPASAMRTMKKDMGGAAQVLGLAQLIMSAELPVRLRVLVPAVENAISGNAYRPGDVLQTYAGISVEIDNTDAEGRLVMCDALALATEENPDLIIDFSTLTGSARSAVGAEISAMFSNDDEVAAGLLDSGACCDDPLWRLPLHKPYGYLLESKVADTVNSAAIPYGGAITAALFLEKFVKQTPWVHFDIMGYNIRERPGRPEGGEAMGTRAVFDYLSRRYR